MPVAAIAERASCLGLWQIVSEESVAKRFMLDIASRALVAAVCFKLFHDLTFRVLGQLHLMAHAVGNAAERVVCVQEGRRHSEVARRRDEGFASALRCVRGTGLLVSQSDVLADVETHTESVSDERMYPSR